MLARYTGNAPKRARRAADVLADFDALAANATVPSPRKTSLLLLARRANGSCCSMALVVPCTYSSRNGALLRRTKSLEQWTSDPREDFARAFPAPWDFGFAWGAPMVQGHPGSVCCWRACVEGIRCAADTGKATVCLDHSKSSVPPCWLTIGALTPGATGCCSRVAQGPSAALSCQSARCVHRLSR